MKYIVFCDSQAMQKWQIYQKSNFSLFDVLQIDVDMIENAMNTVGVDENLLPFGRVKKEALLKAKKILDELV